jgi:hypothetical protein
LKLRALPSFPFSVPFNIQGASQVSINWTITAGGAGGSSEVPEPGTYAARVVGLFDLGTHEDQFQGKVNEVRKIGMAFELVGTAKTDGAPFILLEVFSFGEKISSRNGLRKFLEAWRGRPYEEGEQIDLLKLIDAPCLLAVGQGKSKGGNAYATVDGAQQPMRGQTIPPAATPNTLFECPDRPEAVDERLPDWMPWIYGKAAGDFIRESKELRSKVSGPKAAPMQAPPASASTPAPAHAGAAASDDFPF